MVLKASCTRAVTLIPASMAYAVAAVTRPKSVLFGCFKTALHILAAIIRTIMNAIIPNMPVSIIIFR